jgi:hypothetical protein
MVKWYIASTAGHRSFKYLGDALWMANYLRARGHRVTVGGYAHGSR